MRLLKFYGRTMEGALYRVKKELGPEALIVETHTIRPESATARLHPGAKYEVTAAIETPEAEIPPIPVEPRNFGEWVKRNWRQGSSTEEPPPLPPLPLVSEELKKPKINPYVNTSREELQPRASVPKASSNLLHSRPSERALETPALLSDLARLKSQVRELVDEFGAQGDVRDHADLSDYRLLIEQGVEPAILAPTFRRWLEWRTGEGKANQASQLRGFRAWLWNEWTRQLAFTRNQKSGGRTASNTPEIEAVIGGSGVGKTTTLAKMASKVRQNGGKRAAVLSLNHGLPNLDPAWQPLARLMDVALIQPVTQAELSRSIELFDRFDWIGIDTPAGMTPDSATARLYGFLLARCPNLRTSLVVDTTRRDRANREQMQTMQFCRPNQLIFSKLDETPQRGGMLNLTLDQAWNVEFASTGRRVPEDLESVTPEALWRWVFASEAHEPAPAGATAVYEGAAQ